MPVKPSILDDRRNLALLAFVLLAFLIGGGARYDIASLPILRGSAILFAGAAIYQLQRDEFAPYRPLLVLFGLYTLWMALQLVPLPPAIWTLFPGRELAVESAVAIGIEQPWRPINLVPWRGTNALLSLLVPWAAILLAARSPLRSANPLYLMLLGIGVFSALLGFLQLLGPAGGPLYLYRITSPDSAIGLFSNRNHHAAYLACCLPLVALLTLKRRNTATTSRKRKKSSADNLILPGAAVLIFVLFAGILATGSRGGMLAGALAMILAFAIFVHESRSVGNLGGHRLKAIVIGLAGTMVAVMLVGVYRLNQTVERLAELDQSEELRFKVWQPIMQIVQDYGLVGSGFGSFVEMYEIYEPDALLSPSYLNHAHNDYLEVAMTGGLPAMAIIALALLAYARLTIRAVRARRADIADRALARVSAANIAILAIFSVFDYPLRTPSMAVFLMLSVMSLIWASRKDASARQEDRNENQDSYSRTLDR